jgi:hypothetical protein
VSDGVNPDVVVVVDITVTPVDDAPVQTMSLMDVDLEDGDVVEIDLATSFDDVDSSLTYDVVGLPAGMTFDPATGLVTRNLAPTPLQ